MAPRVGILTLHLHVNFGGILQAAALYRLLSDEGFDPVLLRKEPENLTPVRRLIRDILRALPGQNIGGVRDRANARATHAPFIRRFLPNISRPCHNREELRAVVEQEGLDAVVVGSDQVWRSDFHGDSNHAVYFLDFVPPATRKLAYAASFGHSEWQHSARSDEVSGLLADFDAVSVRERSGVDICRNRLGREQCELVLDPTLVVDPILYEEAAEPAQPRLRPSLVSYLVDQSEVSTTALKAVEGALPGTYETTLLTCDFGNRQVTIGQWLRAFMDADVVFTDSFHGTIFSILFKKKFITLGSKDRGLDRLTTLLDSVGLMSRLVLDDDLARLAPLVNQPIDYKAVDERLTALRKKSKAFLLSALGSAATTGDPVPDNDVHALADVPSFRFAVLHGPK